MKAEDTKITLPYNFTPRPYQINVWNAFVRDGFKRGLCVWHRRAGKDLTFFNILVTKAFERVGIYYYYFPTKADGRAILWEGMDKEGVRFLDRIPPELRDGEPKNVEMQVALKNGSLFRVMGTDDLRVVGPNPVGCVFSEYSLQNPAGWDLIRPILAENDGWAIFNFTPRGRNHAYREHLMAKNNPAYFHELLTVDDTNAISQEAIQAERDAGMREELIQQEFFCFPPETEIYTDRGLKRIDRVALNDNVLTHSGRWRPVTRLIAREYEGDLAEIETYGNYESLKCTPEHPVRTLNPTTQTYEWTKAKDLNKGDFVVMPRTKPSTQIISQSLAKLIGWFITEGSFIKNGIQFTLGSYETEYIQEIKEIGTELGYKPMVYETPTATNVIIANTRLCDFLLTECGTLAANKRIPFHLISGHEAALYETLIKGDGCKAKTKKEKWDAFTTVSKHLAYGVQILASSLGYKAGIAFRAGGKGVIEGREVDCQDSYGIQIRKSGKDIKIKPAKHGTGVMVRSIKRVPYSGTVYNLSVKHDESYVAAGRVVHNCSFDAALEGAFYADDIALAREEGRIGVFRYRPELPVHTAWDLGVSHPTVIWFWQEVQEDDYLWYDIIDYYQNTGQSLNHYAGILRQKGYQYGDHWGPHDIKVREQGTGISRLETLLGLGVRMNVVPKLGVEDGIEAVHQMFHRCRFNEATIQQGLDGLSAYRAEFDPKKDKYRPKPVDDWSADPADAFRMMATRRKSHVALASTNNKISRCLVDRVAL